jgi:plastocyanin
MRRPLLSSIFAVFLAACGGDDGGGGAIDAAPGIDGPPLMASEVSCTGVTSPVITASGSSFNPAITNVALNSVVKFTMPAEHNAISSDGLFTADFSGDTCVRFESPGTFRFRCGPHNFLGSVVVSP